MWRGGRRHISDALRRVLSSFKDKGEKFQKFKFSDSEKNVTRDTPSNDSDHLC